MNPSLKIKGHISAGAKSQVNASSSQIVRFEKTYYGSTFFKISISSLVPVNTTVGAGIDIVIIGKTDANKSIGRNGNQANYRSITAAVVVKSLFHSSKFRSLIK